MKVVMGRYIKAQGEKYKSDALVASGIDALFDAVITFATLVFCSVSILRLTLIFKVMVGAVISVLILKAAYDI